MPAHPLAERLGWAFYLACSWTWCIGLFLPVILHEDFRNGAWLLFWLSNVVGATAFGFVMNSAGKSQAFVANHARACAVFSLVTIAFQSFFIGWVLTHLKAWPGLLPVVALLALWWGGSRHPAGLMTSAAAVWALSIAAFAVYLLASPMANLPATLARELTLDTRALQALPVLAFGFLLCPYLDLTFHQVPQNSPERQGRWSFLIGFPLLFGAMLVFSLAYRDEVAALLLGAVRPDLAPYLQGVLAFVILQAGFTLIVHGRRLQTLSLAKPGLLWACVALPAIVSPLLGDSRMPNGMSLNEVIYRSFMSFYGILAPAWLWLVTFNPRRMPRIVIALTVLLALLLAAIPMLVSTRYAGLYGVAVVLVLLSRRLFSRA